MHSARYLLRPLGLDCGKRVSEGGSGVGQVWGWLTSTAQQKTGVVALSPAREVFSGEAKASRLFVYGELERRPDCKGQMFCVRPLGATQLSSVWISGGVKHTLSNARAAVWSRSERHDRP